MKNLLLNLFLSMLLIGCSSISDDIQSTLAPAREYTGVVTCDADCTIPWQRAQYWITQHSRMKIQTANNVMIQTYNPIGSKVVYGFQVTKEPKVSGGYQIALESYCGNMLGCDPEVIDVRRAFNYYVANGTDLLKSQGYLGSIR